MPQLDPDGDAKVSVFWVFENSRDVFFNSLEEPHPPLPSREERGRFSSGREMFSGRCSTTSFAPANRPGGWAPRITALRQPFDGMIGVLV